MSANLVARLLDTLDALSVIARRMHPPQLEALVATLGDRDSGLRSALAGAVWSAGLTQLRDPIERAVTSTLQACDGLRAVVGSPDALRQTYRALRQVSRAQEALYPVAAALPSVSRYFLEPERHGDQALLDRLTIGAARTNVRTGVMHAANDANERGGFSVYVPEDYDPRRAHPLLMALHGGSGHGRLFLWSWVRETRSRGMILVAPTAIGQTWSLMEPEVDSANLARVLEHVAQTWHVDRMRLLLTGMSDGGTFTLLSGLDAGSPSPIWHRSPQAFIRCC